VITIGTTLTTFAMLDPDRDFLWKAWLMHAEEIIASHPEGVTYFAAIEHDARGMEPFYPLTDRLLELGGQWWSFSLDTGRDTVTQANRLKHITMGQNLVSSFATEAGSSHLLHMAADCEPPPDVLPKLLEVQGFCVAAHCTTYCFDHPPIPDAPFDFEIAGPPLTAVCMLIERSVFQRLRWRYDPILGETDDPSYVRDCRELLGHVAVTRRDCVAIHHPEAISSIETRFEGLDLGIQR